MTRELHDEVEAIKARLSRVEAATLPDEDLSDDAPGPAPVAVTIPAEQTAATVQEVPVLGASSREAGGTRYREPVATGEPDQGGSPAATEAARKTSAGPTNPATQPDNAPKGDTTSDDAAPATAERDATTSAADKRRAAADKGNK
jgi:hypothetical protein